MPSWSTYTGSFTNSSTTGSGGFTGSYQRYQPPPVQLPQAKLVMPHDTILRRVQTPPMRNGKQGVFPLLSPIPVCKGDELLVTFRPDDTAHVEFINVKRLVHVRR